MEYKSIWEWLAIEPTTDTDQIKKAYASQAKLYHPEEKPEEFQQLRKAYKQAMKQTKSARNFVSVELEKTKKPDHTIIADDLYRSLHLTMNRDGEHDKYHTIHIEMDKHVRYEEHENYVNNDDYVKYEEHDEFEDHENLDFKPFFDKVEQEKRENQFIVFLNDLNKLASNMKLSNDLESWKTLFASVDTTVIHNPENFTKIMKALIWRNRIDCEIYEFIYQISITIDGDEEFEQLKKNFKFQYDRALEQKNNTVKDSLGRQVLLKQTLQKIKDLSMNGVGKDNLYLWKDIFEDERVDVLYTAEDFVEIILIVLSLDNLKSEILNYIYQRSEKVYDTSPSLAKVKYKLFNKVNERHNLEYQFDYYRTKQHKQIKHVKHIRVPKSTTQEDKSRKKLIFSMCSIFLSVCVSSARISFNNSSRNSNVKDIPTINMEERSSKLDRQKEERSKEIEKYKDQLDQWYSSSQAAKQKQDNRKKEKRATEDGEISGESVIDENN